jgi:hypothetical protein
VNKVRKKSEIDKGRKEEYLDLLARKTVIIPELCTVMGSFPTKTHTDFIVAQFALT